MGKRVRVSGYVGKTAHASGDTPAMHPDPAGLSSAVLQPTLAVSV